MINDGTCPTKIIPENLLNNRFFISYADESKSSNILSFDIIGSVPGFHKQLDVVLDSRAILNPARRPFEGPNNFFINNKQKIVISDNEFELKDILIFPKIFNNVYLSICATNHFTNIHQILISEPDVFIYPSYYFNNPYSNLHKLFETIKYNT